MSLDEILRDISLGLTGDSEKDRCYLKKQLEKYKGHKYSKEISRAIGRMFYKMIPKEYIDKLEKLLENDVGSITETIKEIKFNMFEKNFERALEISEKLVSKIDETKMFEDDMVSAYFSFDNNFEKMLYHFHNKPNKELRQAAIPFGEVYYIHGNLLFELKRISKAQEYLEKAHRWNPVSSVIGFEYIETFKALGDLEKFFELTTKQFKYIYTPKDLARGYRNLGYYFIEKENFKLASVCYNISLIYDPENTSAMSELYYINNICKENLNKMEIEDLECFGNIYGFSIGPNEDVVGLAYACSQKALEESNDALAECYLSIYCDLVEDEKAQEILDKIRLKNQV